MVRVFFSERQIKSDFRGYNYLCDLYNQSLQYHNQTIVFDFSQINFMEANLCALIGALFEKLESNGNTIGIENIPHKLSNILRRNTFLTSYGYSELIDGYDTSLKYQRLNPKEDHIFYDYIRQLFSKPGFPSLSNRLGNEIAKNIFELYENARTHGRCDYIHVCGQFFPRDPKKPLHFTIVDRGITIKENVSSFLEREISASEAIQWAMVSGNTTKREVGGLGLGVIFEFIKLNKGKIHIVSSDGYYEFSNGQVITKRLTAPFGGTLINLSFNLNDKHYYWLKEESLDNIF